MFKSFVDEWAEWVEVAAPDIATPDPIGGSQSWVSAERTQLQIYLQAKCINMEGSSQDMSKL
eukprot:12903520-Prorocentrum_lima.AAC.1